MFRNDYPDLFKASIEASLGFFGIKLQEGECILTILDEACDFGSPREVIVGDKKVRMSFIRLGLTYFVAVRPDGTHTTFELVEQGKVK